LSAKIGIQCSEEDLKAWSSLPFPDDEIEIINLDDLDPPLKKNNFMNYEYQKESYSLEFFGFTEIAKDEEEDKLESEKLIERTLKEVDLEIKDIVGEYFRKLIENNAEVCDYNDSSYGTALGVEHEIRIKEDKVVHLPCRRLPEAQVEKVKKEIQRMLDHSVIRPSKSPFSSPIVVITKKDDTLRICIDYRPLNENTIKDSYPLPRIDDIIDYIGKGKFYSSIDLKNGYWNIPIKETDVWKTAFIKTWGLYEFTSMPFGLFNF
jgi:hypothetical protein